MNIHSPLFLVTALTLGALFLGSFGTGQAVANPPPPPAAPRRVPLLPPPAHPAILPAVKPIPAIDLAPGLDVEHKAVVIVQLADGSKRRYLIDPQAAQDVDALIPVAAGSHRVVLPSVAQLESELGSRPAP